MGTNYYIKQLKTSKTFPIPLIRKDDLVFIEIHIGSIPTLAQLDFSSPHQVIMPEKLAIQADLPFQDKDYHFNATYQNATIDTISFRQQPTPVRYCLIPYMEFGCVHLKHYNRDNSNHHHRDYHKRAIECFVTNAVETITFGLGFLSEAYVWTVRSGENNISLCQAENIHVGKISGAGPFCYNCDITMHKHGDSGIHLNRHKNEWNSKCPRCKSKEYIAPTLSFTWAMKVEEVKETANLFVDEYSGEHTIPEFQMKIARCGIQFFESIGVDFS